MPCEVEALIPYEKELRTLCNKATPDKRRTLASTKGIKILSDQSTNQLVHYTMTYTKRELR